MSFKEKVLEKSSNSYTFYKENYYKLKDEKKELIKELETKNNEISKRNDELTEVRGHLKEKTDLAKKQHEELLSRIDDYYKLKGDYTTIYWREEWLTRRYEKDYFLRRLKYFWLRSLGFRRQVSRKDSVDGYFDGEIRRRAGGCASGSERENHTGSRLGIRIPGGHD